MKHRRHCVFSSLVVVGILLALSSEACAYIDFGTGSFLIQMAIAGLVGASFAVKIFWKQIKRCFARLFSTKQGTEGGDDPQ